ncbi:unnamed protein product [Malus baccata var. baccata]
MRPLIPSIRNLYISTYKSIVKKWRHMKKKSSSAPQEEAIVDQFRDNDVIFEEVGEDTEKKTMHGLHSLRCISLQRMRRHDPSSPRGLKSVDCIFNVSSPRFSKSSSRKSRTPSPSLKKTKSRKSWPDSAVPSPATPTTPGCSKSSSRKSRTPSPSLKKTKSRKSWPDSAVPSPATPTTPGCTTKSADCTPAHPFLSKSESRKSPAPIMFSNSSGMLKPPAIEKQLECTLEELCFGCQKKMKVTRAIVKDTGQLAQEDELVTIQVEPGWKKGTKITFEGLGNERRGAYPADIIFVISEKRHPLFRREGDDLELALEIPLVEALTGCIISIPLLGGDQMKLTIDDIIYPGYEKIISGQGMAVSKDEGKRGNLKVTFLVDFPTALTHEQRLDVQTILEDYD